MPVNPVAENVLGTIGTILWSAQLIPQIYKSWRTKSTHGLSEWLVLIWGLAGPFLGAYNILKNINIPLIVQPQTFSFLAFISWGQCQYYGRRRSKLLSWALTLGVMAITGGFECALVFGVRPHYPEQHSAVQAVQFFGIMSAVTVSVGLLPQFYEIYMLKEVVGISMTFMLVDILGGLTSFAHSDCIPQLSHANLGVFSLLSLAFKEEFDALASVTYAAVVFLDGLVVLAAIVLNPRARRRRLNLEAETNVFAGPDSQPVTTEKPQETTEQSQE